MLQEGNKHGSLEPSPQRYQMAEGATDEAQLLGGDSPFDEGGDALEVMKDR